MQIVEVKWRPSGGRGEYEHVPSDILRDRKVYVTSSLSTTHIVTDVWGRIRDGKPRIRREKPNDRNVLNLPNLVAALALLPDPIREDVGHALFPLRNKGYVISAVSFQVDLTEDGIALCAPLRMKILHDSGQIDLVARIERVARLLRSDKIPPRLSGVASSFLNLIGSGSASAELRGLADSLIEWLSSDAKISSLLDAPSDVIQVGSSDAFDRTSVIDEMGVDETKRRLGIHYKIDRSRKIRAAKIREFKASHGAVFCQNCSFDFSEKYGPRGVGFIEVHHVIPLAAVLPNTITYLSDLLLLCSNCHRMVHRKRPDLTPDQLTAITR